MYIQYNVGQLLNFAVFFKSIQYYQAFVLHDNNSVLDCKASDFLDTFARNFYLASVLDYNYSQLHLGYMYPYQR